MITGGEYRKLREVDVIGRRVRFLVKIATRGGAVADVGAVGTIVGKQNGYTVEVDGCPHCKLSFRCNHVEPRDLEFVREGDHADIE